jgi:polysaccharide biosynthesis transport protein
VAQSTVPVQLTFPQLTFSKLTFKDAMKSEAVLQLSPSQTPLQRNGVQMEESEGGLNVSHILHTLQRKWLLIVGITLATAAAAGAKVNTDTPTYSGSLEILVRPLSAETEVISNIPETLTGLAPVTQAALVDPDLLKILTSPSVLEPVIQEVKTRYPQACGISGADIADAKLVEKMCYESIAKKLNVSAIAENSDIFRVDFQDPDSQKVAVVLEAASQAYLDYSLSSKQTDIRRGIEFVDQKLPDLRGKVDLLQGQLQSLRLENDLIDPSSRGDQLSGQVSAFSQEQLEVEVQLKQMREVYQDLTKQLKQPGETTASSALTQNPRYQALLDSLLALDSEIAEASTLYLDASPDMQVLKEQRTKLLDLLSVQGQQSEQEIVSQIRELEAREQALNQALQGLNAGVDDLSGISRRYTDIQRELEVATENLTQFLAKREALEIDAAQREIPWEVVTPPTKPLPQPVSLPQNLLLGGMLGLLLGTGAALLLDKSAGVIHSDDEIQRATRLPVLGRIPYHQFTESFAEESSIAESVQYVGARAERNGMGPQPPAIREKLMPSYAQDPFSEAFRSLYTNLRLLNSDKTTRSLAISSVMPSEGKSTVALHLAKAAAAMGQRVLLVDADLRNPQIHNYLELSNEKGLTNLFSGESNPALIQRFPPEPNMYVIAAGSAFFDPTRLFSSKSMKRFADQVRAKFDLVIYDTPPLLGQSDAFLVADHADGLLLVTRPGKLKQPLLDRAMEQLRIADINVLGIVTREN